MKTATQNTVLSEGLLKALALKQHLGDDFFIVFGENEVRAYEGDEDQARELFREDIEGTEEAEIDANFEIFCSNNLPEIEEYKENNGDYLVLTDSEADEKAAEYIKDTLWAFNVSFLAGETGIDEEVFKAIQDNGKCESNNDAIESCIDDMESFVEAAISADGRGHFLAGYDSEENEETIEGETFYIYRTN